MGHRGMEEESAGRIGLGREACEKGREMGTVCGPRLPSELPVGEGNEAGRPAEVEGGKHSTAGRSVYIQLLTIGRTEGYRGRDWY